MTKDLVFTVSRWPRHLSGHRGAAELVEEPIWIGDEPSALAPNLRTGRNKTMGVTVGDIVARIQRV
jgi:hypothetical protein